MEITDEEYLESLHTQHKEICEWRREMPWSTNASLAYARIIREIAQCARRMAEAKDKECQKNL